VVVQLVSGFTLEGVVDCAVAAPVTSNPTRMTTATRIMLISCRRKAFSELMDRTFYGNDSSALGRIGKPIWTGAIERTDHRRTAARYRT
jgi:hypothetical protein